MQSQTKLVKTVYAVDDAGKQYVIRMFIDERDILHKKRKYSINRLRTDNEKNPRGG